MKQLTIESFPKYRPNITLDDIIREMYDLIDYTPNNKEIRLAVELVNHRRKELLFEHNFYNEVRNVLQCDISNERINAVKPFKKILFKKVIEFKDGKHKTVKILRKRRS